MRYRNRLLWVALVAGMTTAPAFAQIGGGGTGGGGGLGGGGGTGGGLGGGGGGLGGGTGGGLGGGGGTGGGTGGGGTGGTALQGLPSPPTITAPGTTGSSGSSALSSSNFLGSTYANPYYQGILSNSSSSGNSPGGFGAPLYGNNGSTGTNGGGTRTGATGGVGGRSMGGTNGTSGGGILVALPVQINYRAVAHFPIAPVANNQLQADLSGMLARSTMIANPASVQVVAAGNTVTLRGIVKDEEEARLIESMVRLTPGVRSLNNELSFPKP